MTASPAPRLTIEERRNRRRERAGWAMIAIGAILAWVLATLAAVWQGGYLVLIFPAGWCLYVALREYAGLRELLRRRA